VKHTLEQKILLLNTLVDRCDKLHHKHGDKVGCSMECNTIIKEIKADLRTVNAVMGFEDQKVH